MTTLTYSVPAVSCAHCTAAIAGEVSQVAGVETVHVDLEAKTVVVLGADLSDEAIRAAIDEAGFDVDP
jgi:copper chaperone CopZ